MLFGVAIWLAFDLARRLFGAPAGWLSAIALFVSVPVWQQVVAVNGTALMMVLALGAFHAWWRVESAEDAQARRCCRLRSLGALCGGALPDRVFGGLPVLVAARGHRCAASAGAAPLARRSASSLAGFAVVAAPWIARNLVVTGLPVGLAVQNVALKVGRQRRPSPRSSGRRSRRRCRRSSSTSLPTRC